MPHWRLENCPSAIKTQCETGYWLIDNNVDLIIEHHSHCIQSVEHYKHKYIFYSLGNTLFPNINQLSNLDETCIPKRTYRFKWKKWNRESLVINYDKFNCRVSVDRLIQINNKLLLKSTNIDTKKQ